MAAKNIKKDIRSGARGHARALTWLGLPLIGSQIAQMSIFTVDSIMLGWYDVTALAALTLSGPVFFAFFIIGAGVAWAVLPMVASAVGEEDTRQARRITRMGLWLSLAYSVVMIPLFFRMEPVLLALGQDPEVAFLAGQYLFIVAFALPSALVIQTLRSFLTALELTRIILVGTIFWSGLNAGLNYALIFGNWGAPELGVQGAAIASVAGNTTFMLVLIVYALVKTPEYDLFRNLHRPDWPAMRRVVSLGLPISLTHLSEMALFGVSSFLIGTFGEVPLAAHGAAMQITAITFMVHMGLSQAITVRAGKAWAVSDRTALRGASAVAMAMSLTFVAFTVALFLLAPKPLVGIFLDPDDPAREAVLQMGVVFLAFAALFQLMDAAQIMALGMLRGVQDTFVPMIMATVSYWVIGLPSGWMLGVEFGLEGRGVWMGLCIGLAAAAGMMQWRFWCRFARPD